jgi:hypothetical protein
VGPRYTPVTASASWALLAGHHLAGEDTGHHMSSSPAVGLLAWVLDAVSSCDSRPPDMTRPRGGRAIRRR